MPPAAEFSLTGRPFGHISPTTLNLHSETPPMIFKWFPHGFFYVCFPRDRRIFGHDWSNLNEKAHTHYMQKFQTILITKLQGNNP